MSYKVRCILNDSTRTEFIYQFNDYHDAVDRFLYFVHLTIEDGLSLRCVNILHCQKCIQLYQNLKFKNHGRK